jgi:hypothetical protein
VAIRGNEKENQALLSLFFANKGLDAINLYNILRHKSVDYYSYILNNENKSWVTAKHQFMNVC